MGKQEMAKEAFTQQGLAESFTDKGGQGYTVT